MKLFLITTAAAVLLAAGGNAQQGSSWLGSIKSWLRPSRQTRPQNGLPPQNFPQASQPFPAVQQQGQQQQGFQNAGFRQRPRNPAQPQQPQQGANFVTRPGTSPNSNQQFTVVKNAAQSTTVAGGRTCAPLPYEDPNVRESPRCPNAAPNHFWNGKKYILTFLLKDEGCKKFTGYQADNYCKANGGRAVSLDTNEASEHFLDVSAQFAQRYYWTGGRLNHPCKTLYWPSGRSEGWQSGQRYWSPTGGSKKKLPQPDNRNHDQDGAEDEICLAVLNNFYNDNIKWHDVACHHKKPTICELP